MIEGLRFPYGNVTICINPRGICKECKKIDRTFTIDPAGTLAMAWFCIDHIQPVLKKHNVSFSLDNFMYLTSLTIKRFTDLRPSEQ